MFKKVSESGEGGRKVGEREKREAKSGARGRMKRGVELDIVGVLPKALCQPGGETPKEV